MIKFVSNCPYEFFAFFKFFERRIFSFRPCVRFRN